MGKLLVGRCAVVTGGSMGIGKAIARAFVEEGCRCLITARTAPALEATARELSTLGPPVTTFPADVASTSDVAALTERAVEELGRIDILVNSAGVYGPIGPAAEVDVDAWWDALRTNLFGTFLCTRSVLPHMLRPGRGKVINLAGGGASGPFPRFSAYACSKSAVVRLTETLAGELAGSGVDVNAIAPGPVNTRLLDEVLRAGDAAGEEFLGRARRQKEQGGTPPERAAELAVFLSSDRSDGLTGRLISAVWDDWPQLADRIPEVMASELYTLRRVTPPGPA